MTLPTKILFSKSLELKEIAINYNALHDHHVLGIIDNFAKRLKVILTTTCLKGGVTKWVDITEYFKGDKDIIFQAYTKSINYVNQYMEETGKSLVDINLHLTYSIWEDTKPQQIELCKQLNLQTYEAFNKKVLNEKVENEGYYKCECVDCGKCKECYVEKYKKIAIAIH